MDKIKKFLKRLEESDLNFGAWIGTVLAAIFIRYFFEQAMSFRALLEITFFRLTHWFILFSSLLLAIIILLHLFSRTDILKVTKVATTFLIIILLPVSIDFMISFISGEHIIYGYLDKNLGNTFLNFFNPLAVTVGVPWGIRIEITLICIFSFIYIFFKRNNLLFSLLGSIIIFVVCFIYISLPDFLAVAWRFLSNFIPLPKIDAESLFPLFAAGKLAQRHVQIIELAIEVFLAAVWFWHYGADKFKALMGNLRFSRSFHYALLVILGIALNLAAPRHYLYSEGDLSWIRLMGSLLAIFFAFQFSVVVNDLYDRETDKISNPRRPLVTNVLTASEYCKVGFVYLVFAIIFAYNVSDAVFNAVLIFISFYFIYSVYPLRLKRFFLPSVLIIALQAVVAFSLGYLSLQIIPPVALDIPPRILWCVFLAFLLAASVKDLKDIEGDKKEGVRTLPVIFGETKARIIIGWLVCLGYLSIPLFLFYLFTAKLGFLLLFISFLWGVINYFYIAKKAANENWIFSAYFLYMFCLLLFLGVNSFKILR